MNETLCVLYHSFDDVLAKFWIRFKLQVGNRRRVKFPGMVLVAEPFGLTSVFIVVKEKFISIFKTSRPIFVCTTLQEKWFMIKGFLNRVTLFINNQSDSTKIPFCCFMLCFILMTLTTRIFFFLFSIFGFRQRFSQQAYSKLW